MLIPRASESSSHWYDQSGNPRHKVPYADKKREGEYRNTSLTDARKNNWLPSVTSVLKLLHNQNLVDWKIGNAVLAALTLPRYEHEDDSAFAQRIIEDAGNEAKAAADFGTSIHNAMENYLFDRTVTDLAALHPFCEKAYDWLDANVSMVHGVEYVVVCKDGYAGTVDLKATLKGEALQAMHEANPGFNGVAILDFKTRKSRDGKFASYDSDIQQLSAYLKAEMMEPSGLVTPMAVANIYLDSQEARSPVLKAWSNDDVHHGMEEWAAILNCWKVLKGYDAGF